MTFSMTLPGLPRAGADRELHRYKKNTKNEGPSKNIGFT